MHGMLSLAVLVAALGGLAGWTGYLLVRLYRACPAVPSPAARAPADDESGPPAGGGPAGPAGPPPGSGSAGETAPAPPAG